MQINLNNFNLESLPTLPTIYQALIEKLEDPKATINDISDTIILDISSTSKLLQIVNSSIFSFKTKVDTITQAISLLGFNEVRNTILTIAVTDYFRSFKKDKGFQKIDLWQHSIATGIISKLIGKELGIKKLEILFISGLLHDVGKLALITNYGSQYIDILLNDHNSESDLVILEKQNYGFSHSEIGYELIKLWNISEEIIEPVHCHHSFGDIRKDGINSYIIYLANIIAKLMGLGFSGNPKIEMPDERIWKILNLREGFLKSLYNDIEKDFYESSIIFKL